MLKVSFIGDSWVDPRLCEAEHWSNIVVREGGFELTTNAGVGGQRSWEVAERFDKDIVEKHPDLVFILCGGNDWWTPPDTDRSDISLKNISEMCEKANKAGIVPVVLGYSECNLEKSFSADKCAFYRKCERNLRCKLMDYCRQNGFLYIDTLEYNDMNFVKHPDRCTSDGFHPNEIGMRYLADKVMNSYGSAVEKAMNNVYSASTFDCTYTDIGWKNIAKDIWQVDKYSFVSTKCVSAFFAKSVGNRATMLRVLCKKESERKPLPERIEVIFSKFNSSFVLTPIHCTTTENDVWYNCNTDIDLMAAATSNIRIRSL